MLAEHLILLLEWTRSGTTTAFYFKRSRGVATWKTSAKEVGTIQLMLGRTFYKWHWQLGCNFRGWLATTTLLSVPWLVAGGFFKMGTAGRTTKMEWRITSRCWHSFVLETNHLLIYPFRTTSWTAQSAARCSKTSAPSYQRWGGRLNSMSYPAGVRQMLSAPIQAVAGNRKFTFLKFSFHNSPQIMTSGSSAILTAKSETKTQWSSTNR